MKMTHFFRNMIANILEKKDWIQSIHNLIPFFSYSDLWHRLLIEI